MKLARHRTVRIMEDLLFLLIYTLATYSSGPITSWMRSVVSAMIASLLQACELPLTRPNGADYGVVMQSDHIISGTRLQQRRSSADLKMSSVVSTGIRAKLLHLLFLVFQHRKKGQSFIAICVKEVPLHDFANVILANCKIWA